MSQEDDADEQPGLQRVGWFRYYFDDDRWEWSPEVERMHGYEPGTVTPTTELVLSHKHPDDRRQIADTLALIRRTRQAFRSRHRILDTRGKVLNVAVLGDELRDENGRVIGTYGFYVDLTKEDRAQQNHLTSELASVSEQRSVIEQAKGMLMMVYKIDSDAAFDLLKWRSQDANVKLRTLAEQVVADFTRATQAAEVGPSQATFDHLLMTAHVRIADKPQ
jgi:PAS domain S-box-containing protein